MPKTPFRKSWLFAALLVAAVYFFLLFRYSERAPKRHYSDFRVYYTTAERFLNRENIYVPAGDAVTPFKYSPTFAFLTAPLALLPEKAASLVFFTLNFAALGVTLLLSTALLLPKGWPPKKRAWPAGLAVLFCFRFLLGILDSGQVNLLMLTLAVGGLYFFRREKPVSGALLLALSVMIKYVTFLFVPYLVIKKRFKEAALVLLFIAAYCLLPAAVIGIEKQTEYLKGWMPQITQTSLDRGSWTDYKNQSLYSLVIRAVMKDSPYPPGQPLLPFEQAKLLGILLAGGLYLLMIFPRSGPVFYENVDLALLFCGLALFNPNSWPFNYASFLFAIALLIYYLMEDGARDQWTWGGLMLSMVLASCASESLVGDRWQRFLEIHSMLAWSGLVVLILLFRLKFRLARRLP